MEGLDLPLRNQECMAAGKVPGCRSALCLEFQAVRCTCMQYLQAAQMPASVAHGSICTYARKFAVPFGRLPAVHCCPMLPCQLPAKMTACLCMLQDVPLFNETIYYNIMYGSLGASQEEVFRYVWHSLLGHAACMRPDLT